MASGLPSLVRHRQAGSFSSRAASYTSADELVHTGSWIPFNNNPSTHGGGGDSLLVGPNGGGGVGVPNYLPFGHPTLKSSMGARDRFGDPDILSVGAAAAGGGLGMDGRHDTIGIEGRPYESIPERNKREANTISEATQLLTELARTPLSGAARGPPVGALTAPTRFRLPHTGGASMSPGVGVGAKMSLPTRGGMPHFDVDKFMRSNHRMLSNADRTTAAEVLRVEPYDRDVTHLATLSKFLASVDFFAGISDTLRHDIAAIATLRVLRKEEAVYSEGDEALNLFVILSGSVGTKVKNFVAKGHTGATTSFVASTIGAGECFGQESMGSEERTLTRTQTKVALERTELLQVDMRDYKSILRIGMSKEAADKLDFVALLPIFEMCTMRELHRIAACMQIVKYTKNTIIIKQGEPSDKVYFIESGEVRVIHKIYSPQKVLCTPRRSDSHHPPPSVTGAATRSRHDSAHADQPKRSRGGGGGGAYQLERARSFHASRAATAATSGGDFARPMWGHSFTDSIRPPAPQATSRVELVPQLLDLGRLGPKWFFGEVGLLKDQPRSASVFAETNVTLMAISKEDFLARLPTFCINYIREYGDAFYASEPALKEQWQAQQRWDKFKAKLVRPGKAPTSATLMEINQKYAATLNAIKY